MIPYLFISGFLGAGKTTLLNALLNRYHSLKIGVIVNDFGDIAVDNQLIAGESVAGDIIELKSGQIFCSCLSGSFIDSVLAFEKIAPDLLLVECSGLAKPSTLSDIAEVIAKRSPDHFACLGMISVIDAARHAILEQSLMVISEQLEASDILFISKTDQIEEPQATHLKQDLATRYPKKILRIFDGKTLQDDVLSLLGGGPTAYPQIDAGRFSGWGEKGRPVSFTLFPEKLSTLQLQDTLRPLQPRWYRLKGIIETSDQGHCFIDGTEQTIEISPTDMDQVTGLVCISHDPALEAEMKAILEPNSAPPLKPLQMF